MQNFFKNLIKIIIRINVNRIRMRLEEKIPFSVKLNTILNHPIDALRRYRFLKRSLQHPARGFVASYLINRKRSFLLKNRTTIYASSFPELLSKLKLAEKDRIYEYFCKVLSKTFRIKHITYGHEYVFTGKRFSWIDLKGRDVLDIGASIGDSAIYFVCNGARKVIGVEPADELFLYGMENIEINKCGDLIKIINGGIRNEVLDKKSKESELTSLPPNLDYFKNSRYVTPSTFFTIEELVNKHEIKKGAFLKVSCEGCEDSIFREISCATLEVFDYIHIEYFYGKGTIEEKLKICGFRVKSTLPKISVNKTTGDLRLLGEIRGDRL